MIVYTPEEKQASIKGCFPNLQAVYSTIPRDVRLHMERVSGYAETLYLCIEKHYPDMILELGNEFFKDYKKIFLLHDIGRAYVPVRVLNKPGGLTKEEFELVKQHTTLAKKAIESIYEKPFSKQNMKSLYEVATFHHEKWDGNGYPEGRKGYNIPLAARICSVADAFDGMVSWKPYRKSMSIEKATAIINEESGKQFQPELIEIFNKCVKYMFVSAEK